MQTGDKGRDEERLNLLRDGDPDPNKGRRAPTETRQKRQDGWWSGREKKRRGSKQESRARCLRFECVTEVV